MLYLIDKSKSSIIVNERETLSYAHAQAQPEENAESVLVVNSLENKGDLPPTRFFKRDI